MLGLEQMVVQVVEEPFVAAGKNACSVIESSNSFVGDDSPSDSDRVRIFIFVLQRKKWWQGVEILVGFAICHIKFLIAKFTFFVFMYSSILSSICQATRTKKR